MKLIKKKFPRDKQMEVNRLEHRSGKTLTLPELLDGLNEVIEELEKLDDYNITSAGTSVHDNSVSLHGSTSPTPKPRYSPDDCCFCHSHNHTSTRCHHFMPASNRRILANTFQLCWKCLRQGHLSRKLDETALVVMEHITIFFACHLTDDHPHPENPIAVVVTVHYQGVPLGVAVVRTAIRTMEGPQEHQPRGNSYSPRRHDSRSPSPYHRHSDRPSRLYHRTVRFRSPVHEHVSPREDSRRHNYARAQERAINIAVDSDDDRGQQLRGQDQCYSSDTVVSTARDPVTTTSLMTVEASALDSKTNVPFPCRLSSS
ncbi:hypothetical protein GCK32_001202 [Trichostrongylus colubriformis]|uniref:Uncharacterized protein n=1 Tax=Trichostrongylus colubriformis TaxID=6319 RepID=A0AAN8FTS0_TRICO